MKKKLLQSGKKEQGISSEKTPDTTPLSNTFYRSIIDLPLRNFITCAVDGNLSALVISGFPNPLELELAWVDIQQEYSDAIGHNEAKLYISVLKEIILTEGKLSLIETTVKILSQIHSVELCKQLNKLCETSFAFDPENEEKYFNELQRCINRSKSLKIKADLKRGQFEAIKKKFEGKGEKLTREYFASILITLSDHAKYPVTDSITVYEYAERLRRFNLFIESK